MRNLLVLPGNAGTNPRLCRMSHIHQLMWFKARLMTSACGVSVIDPYQFGRIHDFDVREVQAGLSEMVKVGLCVHDPDTFELFFLDFFRHEKFRGRGWSMLDSAIQKIESPQIRRLVDRARPARPIDDHKTYPQPTASQPRVQIPVID